MPFRIKRKETLEGALRRVGGERIEHALIHLSHWKDPAAVHVVRKDIKKLRALLGLVRGGIRQELYRELVRNLRNAANSLAGMRDARVMQLSFETLLTNCPGKLRPGTVAECRGILRARTNEESENLVGSKNLEIVRARLMRSARFFKRIRISCRSKAVVNQGLYRSYRAGRKAFLRVRSEPAAENFHEWRKRAKDLWYEVRLMRSVWPTQMRALSRQLKKLSELTGQDHDLAVLRSTLQKRANGEAEGGNKDPDKLGALICTRQRELRDGALRLGARLYVEKPSAFCKRIGQYWKLWRARQ